MDLKEALRVVHERAEMLTVDEVRELRQRLERRQENVVVCLDCKVVLHSKSHYDFQKCNCPNGAFVDGGSDPGARVGAMSFARIRQFPSRVQAQHFVDHL